MFKEMKLSTKFGLALLPLVLASFSLLAFLLGSNDDGRPSLGWLWIAIAGILASGGIMYSLANSMTMRLNAVSSSARHMAESQVPQLVRALSDKRGIEQMPRVVPLDDGGADEIGELAGSFNSVQDALVGIATDQMAVLRRGVSDIFVTLARRNRTLVDRQLALLDELESDVEDPKLLADYYRLDHLSTRMRRNAESLLVLARAETRRRRSEPVAIDDVVRAGISEIEDYQRARPLTIDAAGVNGPVVGDLAHMLAELLDNAAAFSPPEADVTISGAIVAGGYSMTIRDHGIGISPVRLLELNELLATPPVIGLSVEPTLGLSVVSLLAEKHGARVELHSGGESGTIVSVFLPASLFASGDFPAALPTDPEALDAEWEELVSTDALLDADRQLPSGDHHRTEATDVTRELPRPEGLQAVSSPPAPPAPEPAHAGKPAQRSSSDRPFSFAGVATTQPDTIPPIVSPVETASTAQTTSSPTQLPPRTPGASAPKLDDNDTRTVSGEPQPTSSWDAAITNLQRTASEPATPSPPLTLPTRSPAINRVRDDEDFAAGQTATDPEELRNKLNSFRAMSNVSADHLPFDTEIDLNPSTTNEGTDR